MLQAQARDSYEGTCIMINRLPDRCFVNALRHARFSHKLIVENNAIIQFVGDSHLGLCCALMLKHAFIDIILAHLHSWTKWTKFCRRNFQVKFRCRKSCDFARICDWHYIKFGSGNCLALHTQACDTFNPVRWHVYVYQENRSADIQERMHLYMYVDGGRHLLEANKNAIFVHITVFQNFVSYL